MRTQTILFVMISIVGSDTTFGPKAGPYDLNIIKGSLCDDEGLGKMRFGTKITRVGKGQYIYNENFTLGVPLDEHFKIKAEIQKWGNGGWRPNAFSYTMKNCKDMMRVLGDAIRSGLKTAGVDNATCPIPAGEYKANNWLISEIRIEKAVPVMEYGQYRGNLQFLYKNELVGCHVVYGTVVPKEL